MEGSQEKPQEPLYGVLRAGGFCSVLVVHGRFDSRERKESVAAESREGLSFIHLAGRG